MLYSPESLILDIKNYTSDFGFGLFSFVMNKFISLRLLDIEIPVNRMVTNVNTGLVYTNG